MWQWHMWRGAERGWKRLSRAGNDFMKVLQSRLNIGTCQMPSHPPHFSGQHNSSSLPHLHQDPIFWRFFGFMAERMHTTSEGTTGHVGLSPIYNHTPLTSITTPPSQSLTLHSSWSDSLSSYLAACPQTCSHTLMHACTDTPTRCVPLSQHTLPVSSASTHTCTLLCNRHAM